MVNHNNNLNIAGLLFGSLKTTGGYQIFAYNLFRHLANRNHRVTLYITANEYKIDPEFYSNLPFPVSPLLPKTKGLAKYVPGLVKNDLRQRQKNNQHDIWQVIGAYPAGFLATALKGIVPLVLRTHGDDVQADATLGYGQRLDKQRNKDVIHTLKQMDRLVALTPSVSACYRELHIPNDRIVEIPNGIAIDRFQMPINKSRIRQQIGVPINKPLLLTVSRNHPKKGLDQIPEMAAQLKKASYNFHWLIVGKDVEKLEPAVQQHDINDHITLHGEVKIASDADAHLEMPSDTLINIYRCADLFVFPSHLETFGRVLIEAMAAKLPVVTTTAPGCRDVVQHGTTGLQSAPGDLNTMAEHIVQLLKNENLRASFISAGLSYAKQFDWPYIVDRYEALYCELISTKS